MFYRYGGFRTANRIVLEFYDSLFRTTLKRYFEDMDMQRVIRHQVQFVSFLTDGPARSAPAEPVPGPSRASRRPDAAPGAGARRGSEIPGHVL